MASGGHRSELSWVERWDEKIKHRMQFPIWLLRDTFRGGKPGESLQGNLCTVITHCVCMCGQRISSQPTNQENDCSTTPIFRCHIFASEFILNYDTHDTNYKRTENLVFLSFCSGNSARNYSDRDSRIINNSQGCWYTIYTTHKAIIGPCTKAFHLMAVSLLFIFCIIYLGCLKPFKNARTFFIRT